MCKKKGRKFVGFDPISRIHFGLLWCGGLWWDGALMDGGFCGLLWAFDGWKRIKSREAGM